jgi:alkylation response protein AidB-like acyl-CoA dehydrogenase
MDVTDFFLW